MIFNFIIKISSTSEAKFSAYVNMFVFPVFCVVFIELKKLTVFTKMDKERAELRRQKLLEQKRRREELLLKHKEEMEKNNIEIPKNEGKIEENEKNNTEISKNEGKTESAEKSNIETPQNEGKIEENSNPEPETKDNVKEENKEEKLGEEYEPFLGPKREPKIPIIRYEEHPKEFAHKTQEERRNEGYSRMNGKEEKKKKNDFSKIFIFILSIVTALFTLYQVPHGYVYIQILDFLLITVPCFTSKNIQAIIKGVREIRSRIPIYVFIIVFTRIIAQTYNIKA